MNTRLYIGGVACLIAGALVGWLVYDGLNVSEPPITAAKLGPEAASSTRSNVTVPAESRPQVQKVEVGTKPDKSEQVLRIVIPQEKLSKLYIVKCSACHGRDGKGPVGPSIAGKNSQENLTILRKYRAGEVENTMMADLLTRTSDKELASLSDEISQFK